MVTAKGEGSLGSVSTGRDFNLAGQVWNHPHCALVSFHNVSRRQGSRGRHLEAGSKLLGKGQKGSQHTCASVRPLATNE